MSLKKLRTEEYNKLCQRAIKVEEDIDVFNHDHLSEKFTKLNELEDEMYELREDGIDGSYLARLIQEGI